MGIRTEALGITVPILSAPMGFAAGGKLAAAVTAAGGLGIIGGGYGDAHWLDQEFAAAGNSRVGCGFITWSLAKQPELLTHVLARAPAVLMLSFGDPAPFAPVILGAGSRLICQVQTIAHVSGGRAGQPGSHRTGVRSAERHSPGSHGAAIGSARSPVAIGSPFCVLTDAMRGRPQTVWVKRRSPSHSAPAEHHAQVVGRHRNTFGRREPVPVGEHGDVVEIAYAPGRVLRPQVGIERGVASAGMHAALAEGAVEEEQPTGAQDARGTGKQPFGGGPGGDMDHVDRDDGICLGDGPGLCSGVKWQRG
jgi:hypothetical protein